MEANSWMERAGQWPAQTKNYFEELKQEMRRVTWPTWKQVRATTTVVIVAVFAFAAYFCRRRCRLVGGLLPNSLNILHEIKRVSHVRQRSIRHSPDTNEAGEPDEQETVSGECRSPRKSRAESRPPVSEWSLCAGRHDDPRKNWYIIHTYSGFENKVAESLRTRSEAFGFTDKIGQVLIPTEEVVEMRNGKKVTSKRLLYPGYVLVQMVMDDAMRHYVKETPRVTGFVGGGGEPVPLTADEVN